jgi:hypothetical protein
MNDYDPEEVFADKAETDSGFAIAYALVRLAKAQESVAYQLKRLGICDAATEMGALEYVGVNLGHAAEAFAHLETIASSLENKT